MTLTRRLFGSFGASALGPAVTIFIQLINVPVILRVWGPHLYGEWLLISTIPAYLLLTDLGFGNVAGNDMTIRTSAGDRLGAIETFQSIMAFVLAGSFLLGCLLIAIIFLLPIYHLLHLSTLSPVEMKLTLLLLCINCLVILQWSVFLAAYRCDGRYALGMLIVNLIRVAEGLSFLVLLLGHAGPVELAALMLTISVLGSACLVLVKRLTVPWLPFGIAHIRACRIRQLAKPALAFMAFPTGSALNLQGTTILVGITLGPMAVAVFNPLRTLSRTIFQLTDAVKNAVWPELSTAYGKEDWPLARRLHRVSCQVSLLLAIIAATFLVYFGPHLFALWTHGRIAIDLLTFEILLAVAMANSGWNASSAVSLAANRHQRLALLYLVCTSITLFAAYALTRSSRLPGTAAALLLGDLFMSVFVVNLSLRLLADDWKSFLRAMISPGDMNLVWRKVTRWRRS